MQKLLLTLLLTTLCPLALACPVKTGYIANGAFKNTLGLEPMCTPQFKQIAAEVKPTEYGEVYRTSLDMQGGLKVGRLVRLFSSAGWKRLSNPKPKVFAFTKGDKQTVIAVKELTDSALLVIIGDK